MGRQDDREQDDALRYRIQEDSSVAGIDRREAILRNPHAAWRRKPPTDLQKEVLWRRGLWQEGLTRGEAADLIRAAVKGR